LDPLAILPDREYLEIFLHPVLNIVKMPRISSSLLAPVAFLAAVPLVAAKYALHTDMSSTNFFANFDFYSKPDPTNGFVQYQNLDAAINQSLVGYIDGNVFLGTDFTTKDPAGRASVRAESKVNFNKGLLIADIAHMPAGGCGTWPAFWTLGSGTWPQTGEIDILEGVNDYDRNAVTLHTTTGCVVNNASLPSGAQAGVSSSQSQHAFSGSMMTDNCDVNASDQDKNVGCSIKAPASDPSSPGNSNGNGNPNANANGTTTLPTYGAPFNANGGGVYALEWTDTFIRVFFFPRNSASFPSATQLTTSPDPSTWGTPIASFAGNGCDIAQRFKDHRVIFNVAFCGDWAGKEWDKSCKAKTGVSTCEAYVRDNPEAFTESYWEIKGLRWFEEDGQAQMAGGKEKVGKRMIRGKGPVGRW
jgi:hypothetical protein